MGMIQLVQCNLGKQNLWNKVELHCTVPRFKKTLNQNSTTCLHGFSGLLIPNCDISSQSSRWPPLQMSPTMSDRNDDDGRWHQIVDKVDKQQLQPHVLLLWAGLLLIALRLPLIALGFPLISLGLLPIALNLVFQIMGLLLIFLRASPHYSSVLLMTLRALAHYSWLLLITLRFPLISLGVLLITIGHKIWDQTDTITLKFYPPPIWASTHQ